MKETLADGFISYVELPIDEKFIVIVSLVGVNCLQKKNNNNNIEKNSNDIGLYNYIED